jgi:hypothetical protein
MRVNILLFRRTGVNHNDRIFLAAKQVIEPVRLRVKSFYDVIKYILDPLFLYPYFKRNAHN